MSVRNLGLAHLKHRQETVDDWDGECMDLADRMSKWLDKKGIEHDRLWLERERSNEWLKSIYNHRWVYHVVVEIDGMIHDPWFAEVLPTEEYLKRMFPRQIINVDSFKEKAA